MRDFKRDYWSSSKEEFYTIHIPNEKIDQEGDKIADALAEVMSRIKSKLQEISM